MLENRVLCARDNCLLDSLIQVVKCYSVQFHFSGQSKEICLAVNHVLQVMGAEQVLIEPN
jgi:hypothetical protein